MKIHLDCLPCVLRQVLEASRMSSDDVQLHESIMSEAIKRLGRYTQYDNSPHICRAMHGIVKKRTGAHDPYKDIKRRDIETALSLYPSIKRIIQRKDDRLYWALKASAVGNVLDSAIHTGIDIETSIDTELSKPFTVCDIASFQKRLQESKGILIIGDNAGETVFDRLLMEELSAYPIKYAVRSAPIINDATIEEARASGIPQCAQLISTGCDVAGVLLDECSDEFLDVFYHSDIVISKGQGNYETLSDCDRDIFYLLKVKCHVLAADVGANLNDYVFQHRDGVSN